MTDTSLPTSTPNPISPATQTVGGTQTTTQTATSSASPEAKGAPASLLDEALSKAPAEAEGAKDPAAPKDSGPPAKYTDFAVPEGFKLEGETLDKATGLFKELGLDQVGAQKLVDFHANALREAAEGPAKLWQDTQETWIDELRSDPVIGKGIENGTVGASIAKMISALPAPAATAFREAMTFTGAGNNPAIVRGFYELSKRFAEPGHVAGNAPATVKAKPTAAQALFPSNPSIG